MLYGLEDEEEDYDYGNDEYSLDLMSINEKKLNIKKVMIFAIIPIIVLLIVIFSFSVSNNKKDNGDKTSLGAKGNQNNIENTTIMDTSINENEENRDNTEVGNINKVENNIYNGNHVQIAEHNIDKLTEKFVPVYNENAHQLIKDIYASEEKQVYLTFDDGPSRDITPQILDILKENDVKATFFVLGARVELYPNTLKREYDEGHYIANHGYTHQYSQVYTSKDTTFQEYIDCEQAIKNALDNQDYNSYLFRFPGGSNGGRYSAVKAEARELFSSRGIAYTNWNCLTGDAENKKTKEACIQEMINTMENKNSIILLMHDANDKQQTVDALPEIIQFYKNEGYTFKNFYEIFK